LSNNNNLISKIFSSVTINALTSIISYVSFLLLARAGSEEDFGYYLYLLAISGIILSVVTFSSEKIFSKVASLNSNSYALSITMSVKIFLFILFTCLFALGNLVNLNFDPLIYVFLINIFFIQGLFEAKLKIIVLSVILLLERITFLFLIILLLNFYDFNLTVYISYAISVTFSLLLQYIFNNTEIQKIKIFTFKKIWLHMISYTPVVLLMLSQLSYGYFSRIILEYKFTIQLFASISIAFQIINLIGIFQNQIDKIFRPLIVNSANSFELLSIAKKYFIFTTLPVILISYILYLFSEPLIYFLFDGKYNQSAIFLSVLAPIGLTINLLRFQDIIFLNINKNNINLAINVIFSVLMLTALMLPFGYLSVSDYLLIIVLSQYLQVLTSSLVIIYLFQDANLNK